MKHLYFKIIHLILIVILLGYNPFKAIGQNTLVLGLPKGILTEKEKKNFNSKQIKPALIDLYLNGYLSARFDSIKIDSTSQTKRFYFHSGKQFIISYISFDSASNELFNQTGKSEKLLNKKLNAFKLMHLAEELLIYFENSGYPFCNISLKKSSIRNDTILPVFNIEKGPFITIDSIIIKGNCQTNLFVIENIIDIYKNEPYNESKIAQIDQLIHSTPYLKLIKPTAVEFSNQKATVYIYIDDAKASKINGIIGIQPDANGAILFTGEATANLYNTLKKGEQFNFNWNKINLLSQSLKLNFNYPYVVKSKFGTAVNFSLYKRDTSFLDLDYKLGVSYLLSKTNKIATYYNGTQSILLTKTPYFNQTNPILDYKKNSYGIQLNLSKTDYKLNPRKGIESVIDISVGQKKIIQNANLDQNLYTDIPLNTFQWSGSAKFVYYLSLKKRSTIVFRTIYKTTFNENLYFNELFRFGGNNLLRGFDEQSLFASSLSVNTIEYRFFLEQNSYLFSFVDGAWYEQNIPNLYKKDTPYSFGAGVSFETKPGIFTLQYALGTQMNNPILVKTGKVHFGFVSLF